MKVTVSPEAELEADEAVAWYDEQRLGLGFEFLVELNRTLDGVREEVSELPRLESYNGPYDVRRCLLKRFPYVLILLQQPGEVLVVAISHARRKPLYWLDRLT